ncbi:MAG: 30S ribosomal protein S3 [Clostridiales Family XIII bacterium]|jgi:small subunit ribosomal protein S3|nr:30S ribosomal protein S3 [Clostridiales Family XIII bacterium]
MGQKVSPHGLRVGIIKNWSSKWYAGKKDFADILIEDKEIRDFLKKKLYDAGISKIVIERPNPKDIYILLLVGKPGLVIGQKGVGVNEIKRVLQEKTNKEVNIDIKGVKVLELDAVLVAEKIASEIESRINYKRAMKGALGAAIKAGSIGVKILAAGRLNGVEIARSEKYGEGIVPLHTLRANIDYGFAEAETTYGKIGIKVWINKGEVFPEEGKKIKLIDEIKKTSDDSDNKRGNDRDRRSGGKNKDRNSRSRRVTRKDGRTNLIKLKNPRMRPKRNDILSHEEEKIVESSTAIKAEEENKSVSKTKEENKMVSKSKEEGKATSETKEVKSKENQAKDKENKGEE